MNQAKDNLTREWEALLAGRLDELTPEEVARLEAHLNRDDHAAARLATARPPAPDELGGPIPRPAPCAWNRAWGGIAAAQTARPAPARFRALAPWRPLAAAAAVCALIVGLWAGGPPPALSPQWPVRWASDLEINDLEVADERMPVVLAGGSDDTISVIWVLEGEG